MTSPSRGGTATLERAALTRRYREVRAFTEAACEPLSAEDMVVQVAPEASPAKWHLAHTSWFFETFILERHEAGFAPYAEPFRVLFNSYYQQVGEQHPRPRRGVLTRPGLAEVMEYRQVVDERVCRLLERDDATFAAIRPLVELGLQHEQQHQELLLTDIKLTLHANPLAPPYRPERSPGPASPDPGPPGWAGLEGGLVEIGHDGEGFAFDNEGPRHRRFLEPFEIADRLATNGEVLAFIRDGGYERPELWLDEGWSAACEEGWCAPLYWRRDGSAWLEYTLDGLSRLDLHAPACHLSFFEADAFARWAGARLPTEFEWEHACAALPVKGNFVESGLLRPAAAAGEGIRQAYGDVWEWTRSAYEPYPGYEPPSGALGEYNGKFMCSQQVLRGGSCASSATHLRPTYRNFFHPRERWQFSGVRLARSSA